jgi:hypothetical protein
MAKIKKDDHLYERLRLGGVRKRVAKEVSKLQPEKDSPQMKAARRAAADLNLAVDDIKDLITRGPQKRSKAAKKGAKTRKKNQAKKRGAKKGASKKNGKKAAGKK